MRIKNKDYMPENPRTCRAAGGNEGIYLKNPFYTNNRSGMEMKQCDFF